MSNYQQRDMSGILFKNDRKENPNQPDYYGDAMIDGTEYKMSAWIKDGKKGKFMSFSYQQKEEQTKYAHRQLTPTQQMKNDYANDLDQDIPF